MSDGQKLSQQIIRLGGKYQFEKLAQLLHETRIQTLTELLTAKLGRNDGITLWNYLLQGFDLSSSEAKEKRFLCVKCLLDGLLKVELSYRQTYDLITRLCQDLSTFPNEQLVEILEHCIGALRLGDPKCVGWKDLLPETLKVLATQMQLCVNGVNMSGLEYRNDTVRNLCTMRWPTEVLTPIADMFKDVQLNAAETTTVLNKFASSLQALAPTELPALAFQLFSMCGTATQIIVPILAFEKYFHRYYYKKLFADMNSNSTDFDSIDAYSDKELCEAEETILHHLNYCTQYKISEIQMFLVLKNFLSLPDMILTPFMLSAIISMTVANREPNSRLSSSTLLPLLRNVIKHNEDERELADYSVWCRDCLHRKQVDLEQIFVVLIDRNKDGKEVITTGLVKLAFVLLRAKASPALNALAISFLTKFVRKRHVFGKGVIKRIADWMIVEQDQMQYGECLTLLCVADTLTVSECMQTISRVMDFFLWISGEQAMRMMSFILPTLKISALVRDAFIEVLRRAMNSCEAKTRRMAVYGFCMILKQLNNSNSQRSLMRSSGGSSGAFASAAAMCTQLSISGYSLISQTTLGRGSNPQRHFDMLTLEIIGVLRNCFTQTLEIKRTLYDNLQRAVELNPKLVPHILQFIDWHFRSYFREPCESDADAADGEQPPFSIKFESLVCTTDGQERELQVHDNLGSLILFVVYCLQAFEKIGGTDYDARPMKRLLDTSVEKLLSKDLQLEQMTGHLTHYKLELCQQQLNLVEGLMAYTLLGARQTNEDVKQLLPLYRVHHRVQENLQSLSTAARKAAKKDKGDTIDGGGNGINAIINGMPIKTKPSAAQVSNIWDMPVLEKLLRLLHEDIVPFANSAHTSCLRASTELVNYTLHVVAQKVAGLREEPEYKQLSHSRRMLKYLTDVTKVIYERCIKRLPALWTDFDVRTAALAAECFRECLLSAHHVYRKRFNDVFVKGFDYAQALRCQAASGILQNNVDAYMAELTADKDAAGDDLGKEVGRRIVQALLQSLEVLYDNLHFSNRETAASYVWLLKFCQTHAVETRELALVHKLLFQQRQKTHSGAFYNTIVLQLQRLLGAVRDEVVTEQHEQPASGEPLKSITLHSAESCLQHLCAALRKQIDDVEYFILKAQNLNYKCAIVAMEERDQCSAALWQLERAICSQLIHIAQALLLLSNVALPLGGCMDGVLRLLMQLYVCLKNLAKHFLCAASSRKQCSQAAKFDLLLQVVGKPLPCNIYALISYIESNILNGPEGSAATAGTGKKPNPKAEKAKVLRETKLIPKIILCVENFNKHVILLARKTNDRLANRLHLGTVRDFRIKTSELKAAIDRTLSHSSQIEVDPSGEGDSDNAPELSADDEETLLARMENESTDMEAPAEEDSDASGTATDGASTRRGKGNKQASKKKKPKKQQRRKRSADAADEGDEGDEGAESLSTPDAPDSGELRHESNTESHAQVLRNLANINRRAKKRTLRESEQLDADAKAAVVEPADKKRRAGRPAKKSGAPGK